MRANSRKPACRAASLFALLVIAACATAPAAWAEEHPPAQLSLIIDDLGNRWDFGQRALSLSGQVTYAILPGTPYSRRIAEMAHAEGREVMLHQPMEALEHNSLGPDGLNAAMSKQQVVETVRRNLDALPHVRGINNHMGSLLTQQPQAMIWLMQELRRRGGLYFVDSRTTAASVARQVAFAEGLPTIKRDVFLDDDRTSIAIEKQLLHAIHLAQRHGTAVVIGHPYPETLTVLERALPRMKEFGVEVVAVSQLIAARNKRRSSLWRASLSPSPTVAKSSKP